MGFVNNFLFIYFCTFVGVATCFWRERQGRVTTLTAEDNVVSDAGAL